MMSRMGSHSQATMRDACRASISCCSRACNVSAHCDGFERLSVLIGMLFPRAGLLIVAGPSAEFDLLSVPSVFPSWAASGRSSRDYKIFPARFGTFASRRLLDHVVVCQ